ncbi:hypothetical protein [Paenibacillus sp. LHD-38]|uniref:hypothetical protein n=1 Tax=Paenibacillus sp. LHD-38 TaxID=3072143 RepID=UPI00280D3337|nr:hypothetical protein [Paenibacillus sp. LHD-38]MDQ8738051.1 hypothetical protein [Paenibacillus sp. LHD-38]
MNDVLILIIGLALVIFGVSYVASVFSLIKEERKAVENGEDIRIFLLFEMAFLHHTTTFLKGLGSILFGLLIILAFILMSFR